MNKIREKIMALTGIKEYYSELQIREPPKYNINIEDTKLLSDPSLGKPAEADVTVIAIDDNGVEYQIIIRSSLDIEKGLQIPMNMNIETDTGIVKVTIIAVIDRDMKRKPLRIQHTKIDNAMRNYILNKKLEKDLSKPAKRAMLKNRQNL